MLQNWLKESKYTVVFTGAGMSTESDIHKWYLIKTKKKGRCLLR
jgi:hypothetical protein